MQRIGQVIAVDADSIARYKELHEATWPAVLATIKACHISNYSIFLREPENLLFAYFEYVGDDWAADQAAMAADPDTQAWWAVTMPLQRPLNTRAPGEWWVATEQVFHVD